MTACALAVTLDVYREGFHCSQKYPIIISKAHYFITWQLTWQDVELPCLVWMYVSSSGYNYYKATPNWCYVSRTFNPLKMMNIIIKPQTESQHTTKSHFSKTLQRFARSRGYSDLWPGPLIGLFFWHSAKIWPRKSVKPKINLVWPNHQSHRAGMINPIGTDHWLSHAFEVCKLFFTVIFWVSCFVVSWRESQWCADNTFYKSVCMMASF